MTQHLTILDRSVRHHDSMFVLEILHFPSCPLHELIMRIEGVRGNPFAHPLESGLGRWIPFKDSKHFVRPADLAGDNIPTEAASKAEALGLCHIGPGLLQRCLRAFALTVFPEELRVMPGD